MNKKEWAEILRKNDLYAKIMDVVLDHIELVPQPAEEGRCPHFYISICDITKCRESLENLVNE